MTSLENTLEHLPPLMRQDLRDICRTILKYGDNVAMILLHGEFADGNPLDIEHRSYRDIFDPQKTFDLIVATHQEAVADDMSLWRQVCFHCQEHKAFARAAIEVYSLSQLQQLAQTQSPTRSDSICLLYSQENWHFDVEALINPQRNVERARTVYEHGQPLAEAFLAHYRYARDEGQLELAAFQLHHSISTSLKTLLRLFGDANPSNNYLPALKKRLVGHYEAVRPLLNNSPAAARRLQALDSHAMYLQERSLPDALSRQDLRLLAEDAEHLLRLLQRCYWDYVEGQEGRSRPERRHG